MRIIGNVDGCDDGLVDGWITVAEEPARKLEVEFVLDGEVIGHALADQTRRDLEEAGIGDGRCAFSFSAPPFVPRSKVADIDVRPSGSAVVLQKNLRARPDGRARVASQALSRFGGLWIDRRDWLDRLALKHRSGEISDELSSAIFRFVRDGYVVLERAVPAELIHRLNDRIDDIWRSPPEGLLVETFEPHGEARYVPPDPAYRWGRTKLLDLFAYSSLARRATASPQVVAFLSAIFEDKPKAFQGLLFEVGSQQAIHKDTAYVKIDTNPMHLAASWLALENIEAGTGELEYYVGSHRAPDFLFGGVSKWMEHHAADHDAFLRSLHEDAERFGHTRRSFLGLRGDVLIWHADLAHGGSLVTKRGSTRKSLVTHFTPCGDRPFYARSQRHGEVEEQGCVFISEHGEVGPGL